LQYFVKMGRARVHNEATAVALLDAAESLVEAHGLEALTVRRLADEVGTTTRAVYTSLGSKDGLLAGLAERAFQLLGAQVAGLPRTDDPVADLVSAGTQGFRRWALEHPGLFYVGFLRDTSVPAAVWSSVRPSVQQALGLLHQLVRRVEATGGLGGRTVEQATWQFHCLCEGLVIADLRGRAGSDDGDMVWVDALNALIAGWRVTAPAVR